ncbi:methanol dehydrogenase [Brevundimonas sp. Leaf280]|uniref:TPM domain-containing protein n=1 Tax=Brevundimonas sp. Leaf280 TaxID=1736320 RepID=UPI0006FC996B|nr:TPM domain-containing protein [Brevundimonas sp. Leaf280]KQP43615.1 methanol dehydrogenase [Brevundimonas sp. Leaf280]
MTTIQAAARRSPGVAALFFGLLIALLLVLPAAAQSKIDFPPLTGRVVDQANLLDPATEQALTEKLAALEASSTDQLVVVTVNSLQDQEIEDYGYQLGRAWGIGQKENDNGALLIVAPNERKVRVEVGYGLEPILTDAFSSQLIRNDILPSFRDGDYQAGVINGVDALIAQLSLDPAEAQARAQAAAAEQSDTKGESVIPLVIIAGLFLFIFLIAMRSGRGRRSNVSSVLLWAASEVLRNSGRGGGGWGGGGGGFGGGGFGGGGGSFGGGGASGGW